MENGNYYVRRVYIYEIRCTLIRPPILLGPWKWLDSLTSLAQGPPPQESRSYAQDVKGLSRRFVFSVQNLQPWLNHIGMLEETPAVTKSYTVERRYGRFRGEASSYFSSLRRLIRPMQKQGRHVLLS